MAVSEVQPTHQRNIGSDEIRSGGLPQHWRQGVPQLAIPVTFEQPGIAARIAAKKTGMSLADLTSEHLSTLLHQVLNCSIYRENARQFQKIISKTNGLALAANIVERCFGVIPEPAR